MLLDIISLTIVMIKPTKNLNWVIQVAQQLDTEDLQQIEESGGSYETNNLIHALNDAALRLSLQQNEIEIQTSRLKDNNVMLDGVTAVTKVML